MTARILVVDDVAANVKLLEARLRAEYFEVVTAYNGFDALEIAGKGGVDLVLLDVMMPGMDGFEVCRRLKGDPATSTIPVVIITALDGIGDRITGLEAGADDFLTKPANDLQLMTRVKSLVRLKSLGDELRLRAVTTRNISLEELLMRRGPEVSAEPKLLLVDDRRSSCNRMHQMLEGQAHLDTIEDANQAVLQAAEGGYDCIVISTGLSNQDPLRLCGQLRSIERTRFVPIMILADQGDEDRINRAMELGVNDYIYRPVDKQELLARLRTLAKRKVMNDQLRSSIAQTIETAVTDAVTGLHNRRYLERHMLTLLERAVQRRRPLSLVIAGLDHFKRINEAYGNDAGDAVLREFAASLRRNVRGLDLACRVGDDEFVIVMPATDSATAEMVAERIRAQLASTPIETRRHTIALTASLGVASIELQSDDVETLMGRLNAALEAAKDGGRNRVVSSFVHQEQIPASKVTRLG